MPKMKARDEVALINRDHGKSKATPGEWQIGQGGLHLFFWPNSASGVKAAYKLGHCSDVVLMRAGDATLGTEIMQANIQRAGASPDMEAVLLDLVRAFESRGPGMMANALEERIIPLARAALTKSGAL